MASESFTAIFDARDNMSSALNSIASSGNNLVGTFKKVATAAAAAFSVKKIFDFGKECLSTSREFETGMSEVFTLLPGMSNSAMAGMKEDVKDFAKDTGNTLGETTSALYQAISAGVDKDNAIDFLTTANKAAVGGVSDLETAVDGLSSVTNAYGLNVLSTERASDLMFTTVKLGKTTFGELASSLYNVVPTAVGAGVSFDDVSAALAAMTAQGMPTASATVKLRQAISELSQSGTETDKTFRKVAGQSFKEFIAGGGNLQGALQLLEKEAQRTGLGIDDMFSSVEAGSAALALTGTGTEKFTQAVNGMANAAGATDAAYETMENTSEHKIKKMKAQWEVMKADVGAALSDALLPAMEALSANMPQITAAMTEFGGLLASGVRAAVPLFTALVNNIDKVIAGVKALAAAWAGVKIANGVSAITGAVKGLGSVLGLGGMASAGAAGAGGAAGVTGALGGFTSAISGMGTILAGAAGTIAPVIGGLGLLAAGLVVAAKVSDDTNFHWADDMLESSRTVAEQSEGLKEYVNTAQQLKDIELVLKNPDSSKEEIDEAKQKLEEIAKLCGVEYKVTITSDTGGIDSETQDAIDNATKANDATGRSTAREVYNHNKDLVSDISNGKNIKAYQKNKTGFETDRDALNKLDTQTKAYEKALDDYDRAYENFAQGYISQSEYIAQADAVVGDLTGKTFKERFPDMSDDMLTGQLENYFSHTIPGTLEGNRLTRPGLAKELESNKVAIDAYEESVRNAETSLKNGLAADINLGDEGNIKASTALFEEYGRGIKEAGMSTDSAALSFAYAKEGYTDLESALAAGKGGEIAANFESYKQAIGDFNGEVAGASVSLSTLLNAGLSAGGFGSITDALQGGDEALASLSSHMTEYAQQLGTIGESQHIEITASGDISVIDDVSGKIMELQSASGVNVSVDASGNISVLDEASGKMQTLEGMNAVSVQVNSEGNIDILNEASQVIGTINSETAQLTVNGEFSGQDELQAAADAASNITDTSSTIAVIGSFTDQQAIQSAVDLGGQLTDITTAETVNGVFNGKADIAAAIAYQGQLADRNVTYTVNYVQNGTPPKNSAEGTSYFGGGYTYVNDQKGIFDPTELIYQKGRLFTLEGENVLTYLEKGAKIFTAAETSKILDGDMNGLRKRLNSREYSALGSLSETLFGNARRVPEHADGTTSAEDAFIAGEDGPELILGRRGSTVFPSSETNRLMRGFEDDDYRVQPPKEKESKSQTSGGDRRLVIEINGNGSIKTDSKETATEYIMSQLKPKILEIFEEEIYEEGDVSRDF